MSIFNKNQSLLSASIENTQGTESQQEKKEQQEKSLDMMQMYQQYYEILYWGKQYALRKSVLFCQYGTKYALLDCLEDHGILQGKFPVCTIKDFRIENIHDFGSCLCPEKFYKDRCPMTEGYDIDGKPARRAPGNEFAHICKPMVDEQGWKQVDEKVLVEVNAHYVPMLLDDAVLVCQRGGIIFIKEVPDVVTEEKKRGSRITRLTKGYMNWLHTAEGNTEFMYNPFRVKADEDERVTIGHGITFARLNGDPEEEKRWKILQECFGWSEDDMNHIIGCLFDNEEPAAGGEVKEYYEGEGEQRELKNIYYTKYEIDEDQEKEAFERIKYDYFAQVNAAIDEYEITGHKNNEEVDTNYSQCQLEAMFDVAYNQGIASGSYLNDQHIIYYYLPNKKNMLNACRAVKNFKKSKNRRRINQMHLFFIGGYDFYDVGTDEFEDYRDDLGFNRL